MFTKNRDRLLEAEVAQGFLSALLSLPKVRHLLSKPGVCAALQAEGLIKDVLAAWGAMAASDALVAV